MSNYSNTFGGAAKDSGNDIIVAADHDTEYDAVAAASATKANKVTSATNNRIATIDANGDLKDSGKLITEKADIAGETFTGTTTIATLAVTVASSFPAGDIARADLAADIIDSTKLEDNAVNSEHYVDGSIDLAHMSNASVGNAELVDGSISPAKAADTTAGAFRLPAMKESGSTTSASYTKVAEYSIHADGGCRVRISLLRTGIGTGFAKIYVNGSAVGIERSKGSAGTVYFEEDFTGLSRLDLVQLYLKNAATSTTGAFTLGYANSDWFVPSEDIGLML